MNKSFQKIDLDKIQPNPWQPRKVFTVEEIESLSVSIKEFGLIQPITVRKIAEESYELVAGERRYRAARMAEIKLIDAIVIDATNQDSATMALIENVEREDLHFFEEAAAIVELMQEYGLTQEQVSKKLSKKQSTVANKLRILKLSKSVKEAVVKHNLTERHARALLKLPDEEAQKRVVSVIDQKNMNVKQTEDYIETLLNKDVKPKQNQMSKFYCDNKLYINSVKSVARQMEQSGVKAKFNVEESDNKLVLSIEIDK